VQARCRSNTVYAAVSRTARCASSRISVHATRRARWPRQPAAHASVTRCCSSAVRGSVSSVDAASAATSASPRTSTARLSATSACTCSARFAPCARRLARQVRWVLPTWLAAVRSWLVPKTVDDYRRVAVCVVTSWKFCTQCPQHALSSVDA